MTHFILAIVHQLMAAHAMVTIEKIYGTVFENILGEKVSTKPVEGACKRFCVTVGLHC